MARRDRINLTAQIPNESYIGWYIESPTHFDWTTRRATGFIRFFGPAKKFIKSIPFDVPFGDAALDTITTALANRIIAQTPALAGTRVTEDVADPDQDPA